MSNTMRIRSSTLASLFALAAMSAASPALADKHQEQCAGVIKAGKNDCATSRNACHGHVTVDNDPEGWIYVPKGTCEKIAGARVVKVADPTPSSRR